MTVVGTPSGKSCCSECTAAWRMEVCPSFMLQAKETETNIEHNDGFWYDGSWYETCTWRATKLFCQKLKEITMFFWHYSKKCDSCIQTLFNINPVVYPLLLCFDRFGQGSTVNFCGLFNWVVVWSHHWDPMHVGSQMGSTQQSTRTSSFVSHRSSPAAGNNPPSIHQLSPPFYWFHFFSQHTQLR